MITVLQLLLCRLHLALVRELLEGVHELIDRRSEEADEGLEWRLVGCIWMRSATRPACGQQNDIYANGKWMERTVWGQTSSSA